MKLPAIVSRWLAKGAVEPMSVGNSPGLVGNTGGGGWFSLIREPFGGAWQANIEIDGPRDLLSFSGIFAPLTLIAADVAKAGARLVQAVDGIYTDVAKASPFWRVLKRPNHYQNWIQFIELWVLSKLLYGNTYALKVRDNRGMVAQLYILDARRVKCLIGDGGDVYYELNTDALSGIEGTVRVAAMEMVHDRMNCLWHPMVGVSPIVSCALSATLGRRIQSNSAQFFTNMSRPSGMLLAPGKINPEDAAAIKEQWEKNFTGGNIGRLAVLGSGMTYQGMTIPADQAQLLEQLEWSVRDSAAALHVPLFKVGGPVPVGSTIEALNLLYYTDCLQSLIEAAELCLNAGLELPDDMSVEFDVDNLARMDTPAQIKVLSDSVAGGWMKINEARRKQNLPPTEGGDACYLQQQYWSIAALNGRAPPTDAKPIPPPVEPAAKDIDPTLLGMILKGELADAEYA